MEILWGFLGILAVLLVAVVLRWILPGTSGRRDEALLLVQQQVEMLRQDVQRNLQQVGESLSRHLDAQTESVGNRLDGAARMMGDVQRNIGLLGEAAREVRELGQNIVTLENLLSAPKLRGLFGESLLEELLRQVLPADAVEIQHRFRNGQVVDAVIRIGDRMVPVDAKFPLDNFRRLTAARTEEERQTLRTSFTADVRKHVDAIGSKYILPDEGTYPFALMYIPAEGVYQEILLRDGGDRNGSDVPAYALERRVVPVSPASLYAYLQVIALGLKGLRIEESAREVAAALSRLQSDTVRLRDVFSTLGAHLENARKKFDEADRKLAALENRLEQAADIGDEEAVGTEGLLRDHGTAYGSQSSPR